MTCFLGVQFVGPLACVAESFLEDLRARGYAARGLRLQLHLAADLSRWLLEGGLGMADLADGEIARAFLAARRDAGAVRYASAAALSPLLGFLERVGRVVPTRVTPSLSAVDRLLEGYREYLESERGVAVEGARGFVHGARSFLLQVLPGGEPEALARLRAADVSAFMLSWVRGAGRSAARSMAPKVRAFLRYAHHAGFTPSSLVGAVPKVASWRLSGLPKAVAPEVLQRLLASCDPQPRTGRRDLAMLLLMARLGLRAGEVAALMLDDVDWRSGEVVIRGKGQRVERLPLPVDVGEALAAYVRFGRPGTALERRLFIRDHAPHRGLTGGAVGHVVRAAGRRVGVRVHAHQLRHTAATGMLAAGVGLSEIAQVLRHRHLLSTAIYAKADRQALRSIAPAWPLGSPA